MKLRKALEKAKENRDMSASVVNGIQNNTLIPWEAPVYTDSIEYRINPEIVMKNRGVCINPDSPEMEYYKILRTRIQQISKTKCLNTILVTSPNRNEGKTTTCINMGLVFAREYNQTVLMVDCDFKSQSIHKYLGIENDHNLVDYFLNAIPLNQLIVWPGVEKLTLISGNKTIVDSSELLSSEMMEQLVAEMGSRYNDRYVFFDAPPVLERSEAISLAPMMDGILMVVEAGVTSKKDIEKAVDLLPQDKFLGFVLNKKA